MIGEKTKIYIYIEQYSINNPFDNIKEKYIKQDKQLLIFPIDSIKIFFLFYWEVHLILAIAKLLQLTTIYKNQISY